MGILETAFVISYDQGSPSLSTHVARFHNCWEFGVALFDSFLFSVSVRNYQVLVWVCSECFNTES